MNVMIDLETLDTSHSAVVLSIGAVAFNDEGAKCGEFYVELTDDLEAQRAAGRTVSMPTLLWWMSQSEEAKAVFRSTPAEGTVRMSAISALGALNGFLEARGPCDKIKVWGNGSDFDNTVLADMYKSFGLEAPWRFYNNRCFRTLKNLPGAPKSASRQGVHHNALADAHHQYAHWTEINAWLKNRG